MAVPDSERDRAGELLGFIPVETDPPRGCWVGRCGRELKKFAIRPITGLLEPA